MAPCSTKTRTRRTSPSARRTSPSWRPATWMTSGGCAFWRQKTHKCACALRSERVRGLRSTVVSNGPCCCFSTSMLVCAGHRRTAPSICNAQVAWDAGRISRESLASMDQPITSATPHRIRVASLFAMPASHLGGSTAGQLHVMLQNLGGSTADAMPGFEVDLTHPPAAWTMLPDKIPGFRRSEP